MNNILFKSDIEKMECASISLLYPILDLIKNIPVLCKHLDFRNDTLNVKTVVGAFLKLLEDPDKDVRVAFSNHIKYILNASDSEEEFIKEVNLLSI